MTKSVRRRVGVHEAKTHLSSLLRAVDAGEEIEIVRNGEPVARLVPAEPRKVRAFGADRGLVTITEDFDAPLPDDVAATFES